MKDNRVMTGFGSMRSEPLCVEGTRCFTLRDMPPRVVEAKHLTSLLDISSRYDCSMNLAPVKLLHPDPEKAVELARGLVCIPNLDDSVPEKVIHRELLFTGPSEGDESPYPEFPLHVLMITVSGEKSPEPWWWADHQVFDVPSDRFLRVGRSGHYKTRWDAEDALGRVAEHLRETVTERRGEGELADAFSSKQKTS